MSLLRKNLFANFAGSVWLTLMNLAFIPLYIRFLGVESYGLVGLFATIQAVSGILDMGLSATTTREMARLSSLPEKEQEMRDLVRSVEVIYWGSAVLIAIVLAVLSPLIAHKWVKAGQLSPTQIEHAITLMGIAIAFQWPSSVYSGGLNGLQNQILLNTVNMVMSTLRGAGAILVLWLVSPTVEVYFGWQILVNGAATGVLATCLWRSLPSGHRASRVSRELLAGVWQFAAGMMAISLISTVVTQADKIVLSKMLTLETFGYYTLAGVVSSSLYRIIGPVFSAVYPRFIQLVSVGDQPALVQLYHKSCQFLSVLILPVSAIIAFFSYEVVWAWTRSPVTAEKSCLLVSLLIGGTALNGLMNVPYALQLANGWTRLTLYTNTVGIVVMMPMMIFMTGRYGAMGGASVWLMLNAANVVASSHFMFRRLLTSERWRWYRQDVLMPLLASCAVAGLGRWLMPNGLPQSLLLLYVAGVAAATLAATAMVAPMMRELLFASSLKIKNLCASKL